MRFAGGIFAACGLMLAAALLPPAAHAQSERAGMEFSARTGVIRHGLVGHTATHATLGFQASPPKIGALRFVWEVDGWLDGIDLGSASSGHTVDAMYLLYGAAIRTAGDRWFVRAGLGGETVAFGDRYEAAELLPRSSTSPQASLGFGTRIPVAGPESPLSVRLDARTYAVYSEVFDPTGVEQGRDLVWMPAASLSVSYTSR